MAAVVATVVAVVMVVGAATAVGWGSGATAAAGSE
eukprot:gene54954-23019_t